MFKVISDRMVHWYDLWNTILIAINFCNAKKMISELMFIISNHDGINCLSNLLQLERYNVMFNVISDIMAHWYHIWNTIVIACYFCNAKKTIGALMFNISNLHGIKCLSKLLQVERCNVMFNVFSDIMAHWYHMWNAIVIAFNFWNARFVHWCLSKAILIKCHWNLLQLEPCNVNF